MLAFLNFFRNYVVNFAAKTSRLLSLLKNAATMTSELQNNINNEVQVLKNELQSAVPVRVPPLNAHLSIYSDFSKSGIGVRFALTLQTLPRSFR